MISTNIVIFMILFGFSTQENQEPSGVKKQMARHFPLWGAGFSPSSCLPLERKNDFFVNLFIVFGKFM
ncbi:hypothetical protein [Janthinobacterium lividum]|uniref:hypothetical protein n=1 Tax=Janthinobacterium lividum TaxID=29581 RepID=UPI000FE1E801|nr:hypothetical protein [Janthinobacterium lividum]